VCIDAAASDRVAARLGDICGTAARQQRAGQQTGRANFSREIGIRLGRTLPFRVNAHHVRFELLDGSSDSSHDLKHDAHVLNVRQVTQDDRLVGEQTRGKDRQRRILVAAGLDAPLKPPAAFDDEPLHHAARIVSAPLLP
jgi:hypothetical protein